MKRTMLLILALLLCAAPVAARAEAPQKALTVMVYMCGSNLESQYGSASADIHEMMFSGVDTDRVNVLVLTGGSSAWHNGLDATRIQLGKLKGNQLLNKSDLLGPEIAGLSMGDPEVLRQFIACGVEQYPAERYALVLWDHGAGPLEGVCLDELNEPDRMSIGELVQALEDSPLPGKLSWIGFDACLMSTAEIAKALSPYAEYMIASQETEPASGWDYGFLNGIERDKSGAQTGFRIVDMYFDSHKGNTFGLTLSCIDLSAVSSVTKELGDFFEPIGRSLDEKTFASLSELRTESTSFGKVVRGLTTDGYDLVDLGDLVDHYSSLGSAYRLKWALDDAVVYSRSDGDKASGLSVYHPLRNKDGYQQGWKETYAKLDFSEGYQKYLNSFGTILTGKKLADWSGIRLSDDGFGDAGENLFSVQLDPVQQENFSSAQLIVLGATDLKSSDDDFGAQLVENSGMPMGLYGYFPVSVSEVSMDEDGRLSAGYVGRSLYVTDEDGQAVVGPISYSLSDDGQYFCIEVSYGDYSGREDELENAYVLYTCELDETTGELNIVSTEVYDNMTKTYTRRLDFSEDGYTEMNFHRNERELPEEEGALPAFADWDTYFGTQINLKLPMKWGLRLFDEQLSGTPLFATIEVTDVQQNSYCTPLTRVQNPNLYDIGILPRTQVGDGFEMTFYAVQDTSQLNPGVSLGVEVRNTSDEKMSYKFDHLVFNDSRSVDQSADSLYMEVEPGEAAIKSCRIDRQQLAGLSELTGFSLEVRAYPYSALHGLADSEPQAFSFAVTGCELPDNEIVQPLGQCETDGVTWQLLSLRRNAQGGLAGLVRVVNDTDSYYHAACNPAVNDSVGIAEVIYIQAEAHTDVCQPFEISNSMAVYGSDLLKSGNYFLGLEHLLERGGVEQVEALTLCVQKRRGWQDVRFALDEPIPFASAEEVRRYRAEAAETAGEPRLLLDGSVTVNADRLLFGDYGVFIQLTMQNNLDRSITLHINNLRVNDRWDGNSLARSWALGAGTTTVASFPVEAWGLGADGAAIEEIAMVFVSEGFATRRARLRLNTLVSLGAESGTYLSPEDYETVPVVNNKPLDIEVGQATPLDIGDVLTLSLDVVNDDSHLSSKTDEEVEDTNVVKARLHVENPTDDVLDFYFSDFILNDTRYVKRTTSAMHMAPGEAYDCETKFEALDLANLEEITSVACTVQIKYNGVWKSRTSQNVRFEVSGCGLTGVVPVLEDSLGQTELNGLTLRIVSLGVSEWGRLEGVVYLKNGSDEPVTDFFAKVFINGVRGDYGSVDATLPSGTDKFVELSFDNELASGVYFKPAGEDAPDAGLGGLLQRLGMDEVRDISMTLDVNSTEKTIGDVLDVTLDAPWRMPESDVSADDSFLEPLALVEGGVSIGVSRVQVGENGFAVALRMDNHTDAPVYVKLCSANVDGCAVQPETFEDMLLPGNARVQNVFLLASGMLPEGDALQSLRLSFVVGDAFFRDAVIHADRPMVLGVNDVLTTRDFSAEPAKAEDDIPTVSGELGLPNPSVVHPALLIVPEAEARTQEFEYGYATVCLRDTDKVENDAGEYEEYDCLQELCRIPLVLEDGRLVAHYSGLVMENNCRGFSVAFTRETPLGNGETTLRLALVGYTPDEPYDRERTEPLAERGYGILMEGAWTLSDGEGGLSVRRTEWNLTDLATGEAPAGGDPTWKDVDSFIWERRIRYVDGLLPDIQKYRGGHAPMRLTLAPVEALEAELCVCYELYCADGTYEVIADYPMTDD